eukprot:401752-Prorocentrum_lima.AAC.1
MAPINVQQDTDNTLSWVRAESDIQKLYPQAKYLSSQHTWYGSPGKVRTLKIVEEAKNNHLEEIFQ